MRFKIIGESVSFVCSIEEQKSINALYDAVENKIGSKRYLFKGTPKHLVERSDVPISTVFSDLECIYVEESNKVEGPVETINCASFDKEGYFSILEVPADNSCLFHALSELLNARSSDELRKMVANEILKDPKKFAPYIEKDPVSYSNWILQPNIWGGATEITIISKIYQTKVCVIDRQLQVYEFGEAFRSTVYLSYSGNHYNAVIFNGKAGQTVRKFPYGDKKAESLAKSAVQAYFKV